MEDAFEERVGPLQVLQHRGVAGPPWGTGATFLQTAKEALSPFHLACSCWLRALSLSSSACWASARLPGASGWQGLGRCFASWAFKCLNQHRAKALSQVATGESVSIWAPTLRPGLSMPHLPLRR